MTRHLLYTNWNINIYPDAVPVQKVHQLLTNVTSRVLHTYMNNQVI